MKKIKRIFTITTGFFLFAFLCHSQTDSCHLRISLLTCSAGEELYSAWGHTAIRVTDQNTGTDVVFNYGTFDDSDPNFYFKFTRGLMLYALSAYPFSDFLQEYQLQRRGIVEQTLELSCAEKTGLFNALQMNNTDANRFYNYYFHTDNCTSRAKDMVVRNTGRPLIFKNILPGQTVTFRNLIHADLDKNGRYWSKFGIDLFLGLHLDKVIGNEEAMFLPDYLKKGFDSAQINNNPFVVHTGIILPWPVETGVSNSLFTPFTVFGILLLFIGALSLIKKAWSYKVLAFVDTLFFLVIGLLGLLMLILWIIRVDTTCRNNFNILWALPTNILAAFFLNSQKSWIHRYFQIVFWIGIALAFTWFFIPQQLNIAIGPILLLIIIRSYHYSKRKL